MRRRGLALAASAIFAATAMVNAWLWFQRRSLPYAESGSYFDVAEGVSYGDSAVVVFASIAAICASMAAILMWQGMRR